MAKRLIATVQEHATAGAAAGDGQPADSRGRPSSVRGPTVTIPGSAPSPASLPQPRMRREGCGLGSPIPVGASPEGRSASRTRPFQ